MSEAEASSNSDRKPVVRLHGKWPSITLPLWLFLKGMQANLVAVRIHLTENPTTFEVKISR